MRRFPAIAAAALMGALLSAACEEGTEVLKAGAPITLDRANDIGLINEAPESFDGKMVLVEGTVTGVCQGSGCWALIEDGKGNQIYAKSPDHSVALPVNCAGAHLRVQGPLFIPEEEPEHDQEEGDEEHGGAHVCATPGFFVTMTAAELSRP
ncbi:MAG: DUF4920 domain-containing protein [Candidatus Eisenbacteria bacterium]|nr:DUF4920 domain-containing protein [Candidatus Eisenbacteria bacterium]